MKNINEQVEQALQELGMSGADHWKQRISARDVVYLLDHCPFLEISDPRQQPPAQDIQPLKIVTARSGWKIHDFKNMLSSSPGELLYGNPNEEDEGGGSGGRFPKAGTLINQAVITAFEMIEIAERHGWPGIQLVDGHPLMVWAAWVQTLDSGMEIEGYTPTAKDYAKWRRLKSARPETGVSPRPSR